MNDPAVMNAYHFRLALLEAAEELECITEPCQAQKAAKRIAKMLRISAGEE